MFSRLKLLKTPKEFLGWIMIRVCPGLMSDRFYLETDYLFTKREHLDLDKPVTFNEKLQWLKIYDRNPLYTKLVDKYLVKDWVGEKIGYEHVIPTLAKYDTVDEIRLEDLPDQFVLKCNHDSGSVVICKDKSQFDFDAAKKKLSERLKIDNSSFFCEWAYRNVPRCIIAEPFMKEEGHDDLMDYKFFCFDGVPKIMYMSRDHAVQATTDFFDMDFNHLPIRMLAPPSKVLPEKPKQFEKLKELASCLSQGIPQVRVDFYVINGQIYFGEMTFYHCGGMVTVQPHEWNVKMGDMIQLPEKRTTKDKGKRNKFVKC